MSTEHVVSTSDCAASARGVEAVAYVSISQCKVCGAQAGLQVRSVLGGVGAQPRSLCRVCCLPSCRVAGAAPGHTGCDLVSGCSACAGIQAGSEGQQAMQGAHTYVRGELGDGDIGPHRENVEHTRALSETSMLTAKQASPGDLVGREDIPFELDALCKSSPSGCTHL